MYHWENLHIFLFAIYIANLIIFNSINSRIKETRKLLKGGLWIIIEKSHSTELKYGWCQTL